jgi:hypothetical protein
MAMGGINVAQRRQPFASDGQPSGASIAWRPSHELDAREWAMAGHRIGTVGRRIQWLLGDWIAYGSAKFGQRYTSAAKVTGYDTQSLMNMVYVASRFSVSRRRETLSWSHHEAVAALEDEDQETWLDRAVEHRWSVSDLRMMLRAARRQEGSEPERGARNDATHDRAGARYSGRQSESTEARHMENAQAQIVMCPRCGEEISVTP